MIMINHALFLRAALAMLLCAPLLCFSQGVPNVVQDLPPVPSANAQNLGLFGEVPISYNTGIASVSVPIYQIRARDFSVPITLDYHGSGFRPDMHPSWVGMGWSLNTGGAITRQVKGFEDEANYSNYPNWGGRQGYYMTFGVNNSYSWNDPSWLNQYRYDQLGADMEPDVFKFSFPGHTGEFFLDDDKTWKVRCNVPVKVVFDDTWTTPFPNTSSAAPQQQSSPTFKRFTITDEKGVQYVFGNTDDSTDDNIEYSDAIMNDDGFSAIATTWNLKKIISADGTEVVTYTYERGPYQAELFNNIAVYDLCNNFDSPVFKVSGKLVSPVYLKNINYNKTGLNINFGTAASNELSYSDADWNHLFDAGSGGVRSLTDQLAHRDKIPYFNNNPTNSAADIPGVEALIWLRLQVIDITSSGFERVVLLNYINSATERLKLGSINIKPGFGYTAPFANYTFDYYNSSVLPNYLTNISDSWGFYNDQTVAYNTVYGTPFNYYKQPTSDPAKAVNGTLKTITYPTGGSSLFEYEQHQFAHTVDPSTGFTNNQGGIAGGLRIKDIVTSDNNGNQETKNYYYVGYYSAGINPATSPSSGILEAAPRYDYQGTLYDQSGAPFNFSYFSSNPVIPVTSSSTGQHVNYSKVIEERSDGAYTTYTYTDQISNPDIPATNTYNASMLPVMPSSSKSLERGLLLGKYVNDKNNNAVSSEEYFYPNVSGTALGLNRVPCVQQKYKNSCVSTSTNTAINREPYYRYYYYYKPYMVITKTYGNPNPLVFVTHTRNLAYNYFGLLQFDDFTNSDGVINKTTYSYAYENISGMLGKNMLDFKSQIDQARNGQVVKSQKISYSDFPNAPGNFYPQAVTEKETDNDPEYPVAQISGYDQGNITQQILKGGSIESFQWGYNKTYPIAKLTNAANNQTTVIQPQSQSGTVQAATYTNVASFTTAQAGNITLAITLTSPPTVGFTVSTQLVNNSTGAGQSISLCFSYGGFGCGPNSPSSITYPNMPAGNYTLIESASNTVFANITYTYTGASTTTTGATEFYYQNYEEGAGGTFGNAHTGNMYYNGSTCFVAWTKPNTRAYVYSYWYLNGSTWTYSGELPYTSTYVQLTGGTGYDDVRIYPKDAQMTTYTYIPDVGISSATDPKGQTIYYEYDPFSRLMNIKDKDGNIIKHIDYHYQGQ